MTRSDRDRLFVERPGPDVIPFSGGDQGQVVEHIGDAGLIPSLAPRFQTRLEALPSQWIVARFEGNDAEDAERPRR
jgi:hypothetical protein